MKILFTIILIAISPSLYAQITVNGKQYKKGEVVENDQIDKFQGKYVWKNGTDVFRLNLKRDTIRIISSNPFVHLNGTYEYSQNGKVVYSYAKNPVKYGNLSGGEVIDEKLIIFFKDETVDETAKGWLALNKDNGLIWNIKRHDQGIRIGKRKELIVPTEMILEKISD
jgi:hypothetical protein